MSKGSTHLSRYIPLDEDPPEQASDWEAITKVITSTFQRQVGEINKWRGDLRDLIYTGSTGIAFVNYRWADMNIADKTPAYLTPAALRKKGDEQLAHVLQQHPINHNRMYSDNRLAFLDSHIGIATLVLSRTPLTSNQTIIDNWAESKYFLRYTVETAIAADGGVGRFGDKEDGSEVLYGRAGLLYSLLYLRKHVAGRSQPVPNKFNLDELTSDELLSRLVDSIILRGKYGAEAVAKDPQFQKFSYLPPLMWRWHGKRYLGAAHGVAGILQMLLLCPMSVIQKNIPDIFSMVLWLVDLQDKAGNWPSKWPVRSSASPEKNDLVQWCHGAPGIVITLSTALAAFRQKRIFTVDEAIIEKITSSIRLGAECVYKRGLLTKGVGLCHGVAGSVYALLAASKVLDEEKPSTKGYYLVRAVHLAKLATEFQHLTENRRMVIPDHPWSLFEGLGGMCCAWIDVVYRIMSLRCPTTGFPAYDDIA